eukprot:45329-Lingulodinium_polyedra.AAC.1
MPADCGRPCGGCSLLVAATCGRCGWAAGVLGKPGRGLGTLPRLWRRGLRPRGVAARGCAAGRRGR